VKTVKVAKHVMLTILYIAMNVMMASHYSNLRAKTVVIVLLISMG
jgi:hypothetical protein